MSYWHYGTIHWDKTDFTMHGTIAMYAIGECRCDECEERWENWEPLTFGSINRHADRGFYHKTRKPRN